MNYFLKTLYLLLSLLFFLSCKSAQTTSVDFTPEKAFTAGIEGPAVDEFGNLYAVNYKEEGTIGKIDDSGRASIFVKLPNGSIGNGIRFNAHGDMFIADYTNHNVLQIKKGTKEVVIYAHNSNMSQPNDLAIAPNGTIYLSDPNWANNTGKLWYVTKNNTIKLLEENMGTTNGIEVSPDGKTLYVNESVQRKVWKYTITADGSISNKTMFLSFPDFGLDGMRCDFKGNLYITRHGKGTVVMVSPKGKTIKEVKLKGKKPSNITFGGKTGKTCYVTMADRGCFESFSATHKGSYFKQIHN